MNLLLKGHWFFPVKHAPRPRLNTKLCLRLTKSISKHEKPLEGVKLAKLSFISIVIRHSPLVFCLCIFLNVQCYGLLFHYSVVVLSGQSSSFGNWFSNSFLFSCDGSSKRTHENMNIVTEIKQHDYTGSTLKTQHDSQSKTNATVTFCICQYNCCLHSYGRRCSLELYLNYALALQVHNKNKIFCVFCFARQNTETSSPSNVYSATVFGLCTALSRLAGRKCTECARYTAHGCLFSIDPLLMWMDANVEGCFSGTVRLWCFAFSLYSWVYRFCVQAKTHQTHFVYQTKSNKRSTFDSKASLGAHPLPVSSDALCHCETGKHDFSSVQCFLDGNQSMCSTTCALLQHSNATSSTGFEAKLVVCEVYTCSDATFVMNYNQMFGTLDLALEIGACISSLTEWCMRKRYLSIYQ